MHIKRAKTLEHIFSLLQYLIAPLTTLRSRGYHWYHLVNQHQHRHREQTIVVVSMNTILDVSFRYRWIHFNCFLVNHRKWGVELSKPVYWICYVMSGKQKVLKLIKHSPGLLPSVLEAPPQLVVLQMCSWVTECLCILTSDCHVTPPYK